jgi:tRNA(Arg) A34 adenosine deaminase TadA
MVGVVAEEDGKLCPICCGAVIHAALLDCTYPATEMQYAGSLLQ